MLVRKNEFVDIDQYPTKIALPKDNVKLVYGDLDGNALKLIYCLVREGVIYINRKDYSECVRIYQSLNNHLAPEDLMIYNQILNDAKKISPSPSLTLIGDELCDRGKNDYFILKLIQLMSKLNINFEILYSNHASQFLRQYSHGLDKENVTPLFNGDNYQFGRSLHNLQILIQKGYVDADELNAIVELDYLPRLKLLSYYHYKNDETDIMAVLTHAPIKDMSKIKEVSKLFKRKFNDETSLETIESIKRINHSFQNKMQNSSIQATMADNPKIEALINDRYYDLENNTTFTYSSRPYIFMNIHGHVGTEKKPASTCPQSIHINTDMVLGKTGNTGLDIHQHEYEVLTTDKKYLDVRLINNSQGMFAKKPVTNPDVNKSSRINRPPLK